MATVNDATRNSIWVNFENSEYYSRYYSKLADKYRRRYLAIRFAILTLVLVEAMILIPFMSRIPEPGGPLLTGILGAIIIGLTVFEATSNDATNTAKLNVASDEFRVLHSEWQDLWLDIESDGIEDDLARQWQRALTVRTNLAGARVEISQDKTRNKQAAEEANEVMDGRYAKTT